MASKYKADARAAKASKMTRMGIDSTAEQATGPSDVSSFSPPKPINTNKKAGQQPPAAAIDGRARAQKRLGMGQRRPGFASGGAVKGKGKTNINIIIAPQGAQGGAPAGGAAVPPPLPPSAVMAPPAPPPGPAGGMPPGLAAAMAGGAGGPPMAGPPPMAAKRGGRIQYASGGRVAKADGGALPAPVAEPDDAYKTMVANAVSKPPHKRTQAEKDAIAKEMAGTKRASGGRVAKADCDGDGDAYKKGGAISNNMSRRFAKTDTAAKTCMATGGAIKPPTGKAGAKSGPGRLAQAKHYAGKVSGDMENEPT